MPPIHTVTAVLGPTNTGKTHLAIERMLAHGSGMIGLPLRLLAREVYDQIVARVGRSRRGADHRRGEDQARRSRATGSPPSRRCRAISTCRSSPSTRSSSRRSRARPCLHRPPAATGAAATKRCCWAPPPCAADHRAAAAGRQLRRRGRGCRKLTYAGAEEDHAAAARAPPSSPSRPTRSTPSPN